MPPNPYAAAQQVENQTPIGFGAERANLMGEQTVSMPEQTPATDAGAAGEEAAGSDLEFEDSQEEVLSEEDVVQRDGDSDGWEDCSDSDGKMEVDQEKPKPTKQVWNDQEDRKRI